MAKKNNNWKWVLGIGAGFGIGYLWLRKQADLIQFGSVSVPYQAIKSGNLILGLRLPIINASSLGARITGFTGYILTPSGSVIGTVFMPTTGTVAPYQQATLGFDATLKIADIITEAGTQIVTGSFPTNWSDIQKYLKGFRLKGQVRVFGIPIPIEMPLI